MTTNPGKDDEKMGALRFVILFLGGLVAYFGSKAVELEGAGALAVLVMAFVAGIGWYVIYSAFHLRINKALFMK